MSAEKVDIDYPVVNGLNADQDAYLNRCFYWKENRTPPDMNEMIENMFRLEDCKARRNLNEAFSKLDEKQEGQCMCQTCGFVGQAVSCVEKIENPVVLEPVVESMNLTSPPKKAESPKKSESSSSRKSSSSSSSHRSTTRMAPYKWKTRYILRQAQEESLDQVVDDKRQGVEKDFEITTKEKETVENNMETIVPSEDEEPRLVIVETETEDCEAAFPSNIDSDEEPRLIIVEDSDMEESFHKKVKLVDDDDHQKSVENFPPVWPTLYDYLHVDPDSFMVEYECETEEERLEGTSMDTEDSDHLEESDVEAYDGDCSSSSDDSECGNGFEP